MFLFFAVLCMVIVSSHSKGKHMLDKAIGKRYIGVHVLKRLSKETYKKINIVDLHTKQVLRIVDRIGVACWSARKPWKE